MPHAACRMPHAACMLQMIRVLHAIIHNFVANSFACIFIADAFGKRKVPPTVSVSVCVCIVKQRSAR